VAELMNLKAGDCVPLDAVVNQDVELRLNGSTIARGELVTVGDNFGVRILEILK
jgi:flagellar motor switch protein FliN/FliY